MKDEEWNARHGYTYFHFGWVLPALGIFFLLGIIVIPIAYYLNVSTKVIVVLAWILAFAIFGGFMTVLTATGSHHFFGQFAKRLFVKLGHTRKAMLLVQDSLSVLVPLRGCKRSRCKRRLALSDH